jgi:hypothetical protein
LTGARVCNTLTGAVAAAVLYLNIMLSFSFGGDFRPVLV